MSDIELVIKIDKETYNDIQSHDWKNGGRWYSEEWKAIHNGTPLPKGHGRLCDLDAALRCVNDNSVEDCDAKWQAIGLFEWAMAKRVVIEADKAESEE